MTPDTPPETPPPPRRRRRPDPLTPGMRDMLLASCRNRRDDVLHALDTNGIDYDPLARMRITDPGLYRITLWRARPEHLAAYRNARAVWRRKARSAAGAPLGSWRSRYVYEKAEFAALDMRDAARLVMGEPLPVEVFSTLFGRKR